MIPSLTYVPAKPERRVYGVYLTGNEQNNLDYLDENASKLARRVQKSELNLKNTTIQELQKMNRVLDKCPLCYHEDTNKVPIAPVISLGTRVYLTLPTMPEISGGSACIVPIQHRVNLLECDDDEWEEIRVRKLLVSKEMRFPAS